MSWRQRIVHRIGRRGFALMFFSFLDFVYGLSLANPPPAATANPMFIFISQVMPPWVWGLIWCFTGTVCLVGAFAKHDRWAFTAAIALKTLWGTTFLLGWIFYDLNRGYVSAAIWLVFAAWIFIISTWPEPIAIPSPEDLAQQVATSGPDR